MPRPTQPESGTQFWGSPHLAPSRRMFFRHLAAGVSGYWLLPQTPTETIARAADVQAGPGFGRARQVIFILLAGAPSHVDTFDFKEGEWTPRDFAPETFGDLRFPQGLLPGLASEIGDLAFLRSVRAWAVVHGIANQWMQMARNPVSPGARIAPHIGSIVSRELAGNPEIRLPAFFALNAVGGQEPGSGFLPAEHAPILLQPAAGGGLSPQTEFMDREAYRRRRALLERIQGDRQFDGAASGMAILQAGARELLFDDRVESMFRFTEAESIRYGATAFGNSCLIARNLITSRQGVRYVEITHPGWDHHADIYRAMPALAREFDRGLATLLNDLRSGGLLNETLVIAMGEFGRTVGALNGLAGRDHYQQQAVMLAGAGIRGGRAIGATNATGAFTTEPGWSANRNIRPEDIAATLYNSLGIDWTKSVHTESGSRFDYLPATGDAPYAPVFELWR